MDSVLSVGTNPTVMLLKELLERQEIRGERALWVVSSLGHSVQTPTIALFHNLLVLYRVFTGFFSSPPRLGAIETIAPGFY